LVKSTIHNSKRSARTGVIILPTYRMLSFVSCLKLLSIPSNQKRSAEAQQASVLYRHVKFWGSATKASYPKSPKNATLSHMQKVRVYGEVRPHKTADLFGRICRQAAYLTDPLELHNRVSGVT